MFRTPRFLVLLVLASLLIHSEVNAEVVAAKEIESNVPSEVRTLIEKLYSSDRVERRNATLELWDMGPNSSYAVPHLIMMLNDKDWNVRKDAIFALSIICDNRSVEPLTKVMNDDPIPAIRKAAELALKNMNKRDEGACKR